MQKNIVLALMLLLALPFHAKTPAKHQPSVATIDLSGTWRFSTTEGQFDETITLPGSMLTNGKGQPVTVHTQWTGSLYDSSYYFNPYMERYRQEGNMKFPFFLTPSRHYVGAAWYERMVTVPRQWRKHGVVLYLERPHIETTVWVNGQEAGHQMSLSVPHVYDLSRLVRYGKENTITIRVYNGIENVCVGQDSHSVTDQTQGNWNGVVGRMELQNRTPIYRLRTVSDIVNKRVRITVNEQDYTFDLGDTAQLWDEHHPRLYTRTVVYHGDSIPVTFGLRQISIRGRQFYLNNKPVWMRGTVENCCFPETGFPPTDVASWEKIFRQCKAYGLNHMRFHSYCPPDAAFTAADRVGFYLQPEGPSWPNHGVKLRRGQAIDQYLLDECKRMVDTYGHHPSFVMMAAGNEPAGDWVSWCNDFVRDMHQYDSTRVYCGASVGGGWAWDDGSEYHVKGGARGLDWDKHAPHSDDDYFSQIAFPRNYKSTDTPNNSPIIAHEQGQWCAFPDFDETSQYTGAYKARNFEIFADLLRDNGMASQARHFLHASGKLQVLAYKYEMERNLRTKDYAGFQLLGLNDYSGQGTALVGPLNVHWREKGYCTAQDWREFCSSVVPLARFPKFVFENKEQLQVPVEFYNASGHPLSDALATWQITGKEVSLQGHLCRQLLPEGKNIPLGTVSIPLATITQPTKLTLTVSVESADNQAQNHWDFWVYPAEDGSSWTEVEKGKGPFITDTLDEKALSVLRQGGDVLLTAAGRVRYGRDVVHRYLPVFWNTSWFKMRPPHTTGAYIQAQHPVFSLFPTDDWQDLQWWELVNGTQVMNLSEFPADYQPIVQPIDTWHVSRKLGMMIEARVFKGRLLMTTIDITSHLDRRPVARQLRQSILNYMQGSQFQPQLVLKPEVIEHLFTHEAPPVNMFTNDSPDELKPKLK